jgi:predicted metal-binding protein
MEELVKVAMEAGASTAELIDSNKIVVDERVILKCYVPRCDACGKFLMCPPHVMSVKDFKEILSRYQKALIVQIESEQDSLDKSGSLTDEKFFKEQMKILRNARLKLNELIDKIEKEAFKKGYAYAAGFSSGRCELCGGEECPGLSDGICRHPFRGRPSMEAVGIDVLRTAINAGLKVELSSGARVKFTGLVLIE